ncbi:MAG: purine-nucleoside phosphorylase [Mollicutes bacterium]|jgi:purine-nucleoside phosphorylase|nr:purine-nucleoside phosphorylase [Mollicutes bacterium]
MTPHIEAKKEDIASIVIMPGDPLRAKYIAENYLTDYMLVNDVRNMLAYTGYYKGKRVTVMASGMGNPSMGIYSYELFKFYDVDTIIRVGSCGAYTKNLNLYDLILVEESYSDSNYAFVQNGFKDKIITSSSELNEVIIQKSKELNINLNIGRIHCTDVFYKDNNPFKELYEKYNCLATEMETFALFSNAKYLNKKATCILTVSDNLETKEETTSEERQNAFTQMIELALESIL